MKKSICITSIIFALVVGISSMAAGKDGYMPLFNTRYGTTGTRLDSCTLCHSTTPALNSYGAAYGNNDRNFATIEPLDSDSDGFSNIVEINARTFPGDPNSKPASGDVTKPKVTGFTVASPSTSLTINITTFTATDNVGVTGYMVTKSNLTAPLPSSLKWSATPPTTFTFPATAKPGAKTLYAWAKDKAGNVSNLRSAPVTLDIPGPDVTKPIVTGFTVASPSTSLTINITTFTATDNVAVTGYLVKRSSTVPVPTSPKWSPTPPTSFTFPTSTTSGPKTLYGFAKDAAGNIRKSLPAQVTLTLATAAQSMGTSTAAIRGTPTEAVTAVDEDMSPWIGIWFKVDMKAEGYDPVRSKLSGDRQTVPGYLKIWGWDPVNKILQSDLYLSDSQTDQWVVDTLPLYGVMGNALDFRCWSQVTGDITYGFTARIRGEGRNGLLTRASFQTLGGYTIEEDLESGAPQHLIGWLTLTGALVDASEVPVPSAVILN
jgi:hypothetical protein